MAVQTTTLPAGLPRTMTREQFEDLSESGELDGVPVELLEGEVVWMGRQGDEHLWATGLLARELDRRLSARHGDRFVVIQHSTLAAGADSLPEPDVSVRERGGRTITGLARGGGGDPLVAESALVVEVAQTSHHRDLGQKVRVYAAAGVPEYWVLDLRAEQLVVHRQPRTGPVPGYGSVRCLPYDAEVEVLGVRLRVSEC